MLIEGGGLAYEWLEGWGKLPDSAATRSAWPHAGITVTPEGEVVTFHPASEAIISFDRQGNLRRTQPVEVTEAHGVTLVVEGGSPLLWLADASMKMRPDQEYAMPEAKDAAVVKVSLEDGRVAVALPLPDHPAYQGGKYRPTSVAVDEPRFGGGGKIWVADGYGESLLHRFSALGEYLGSLSGEEGGGRFQTPHAVFIDRRRSDPELYVADRTNARIQVYGLDGQFRRVIGEGTLASPTGLAVDGDLLLVVEFRPPRLTVLDAEDRLVTYLAANPYAPSRAGWPNDLGLDAKPVRTKALVPGN